MRICIFLFGALLFAGEPGTKMKYVGGTLGEVRPGNDLRILAANASELRISMKARSLRIPYSQINQIKYGQKMGRQVLAAITVSPLFLLNKTRKHFLTLDFTNTDDSQQAIVIRMDKKDIRAVLTSLEARTGLRVTYLDNEAKKI